MCRRKHECSELGTNPASWDRHCPLRPPSWIEEQLDLFIIAVEALAGGNREECHAVVSRIDSHKLRHWYVEHGQVSGKHRTKALGITKPCDVDVSMRDSLRSPRTHQNDVFARDGYRCRYCGSRLVSRKLLKEFPMKLGSTVLQKGRTNLLTHGIIHATWPVADHVLPWKLGGRTNMENLVTACGACNYGKDRFTCEQMGIENPWNRAPIVDGWVGLFARL